MIDTLIQFKHLTTLTAKIGRINFLLYLTIFVIGFNKKRETWKVSLVSSFNNEIQTTCKKKKARMQGEHIKTTSLRRMVTKVKHNSQAIVSMNNGSEPTSSVILPCLLTKSLCGLAVVHI